MPWNFAVNFRGDLDSLLVEASWPLLLRVSILVTMQHVAILTATLERDNMGLGVKYTDVRCHHPKGTVFVIMFFLHFFEVWGRSASRVAWPQKQWWNMLDSTGKKACWQRKYLNKMLKAVPFLMLLQGVNVRIRWIPKSVCDLCGDHLDASLGASQGFWQHSRKRIFGFLRVSYLLINLISVRALYFMAISEI